MALIYDRETRYTWVTRNSNNYFCDGIPNLLQLYYALCSVDTMRTSVEHDDLVLPLPGPVHGKNQDTERGRTISASLEERNMRTEKEDLIEGKTQNLSPETPEKQKEEKKVSSIPFLGIILVLCAVTIFQGGSVVAKKLTINPFLLVLIRDVLQASFNAPFVIQANKTPFPKGRVTLVGIRGLAAGIFL